MHMMQNTSPSDETATIERVIKSSITWAMTKDKNLLYRCFVNDSTLFYFSPDRAGTIKGFQQFTKLVDELFMNPAFKAVRSEFKELTVNQSKSGDVAWWSCILDDFNEWQGKPSNWENVRWTGVLERLDGQWRIMQMHFSYAVEDMRK